MSSLIITTIQTALHWEDKTANLQMLKKKINSITNKTHIVVLPEMFSTGFSMNPKVLAETMNGTTIQWMKEMAADKKIILTGSIIIEEEGKYYNRMIWMQPDGVFGLYDKRHLFANSGEDAHYTAGKKRCIVSVNGWKVALSVCYDLRFPVWARQQYKDGSYEYDVLLCVANWPNKRSLAWKTLLQARAIENQCYAVGVNRVGRDANDLEYSGDSMVIDPLGAILYQKEADEDIFTIGLNKQPLVEVRQKLPFWKEADRFEIFAE